MDKFHPIWTDPTKCFLSMAIQNCCRFDSEKIWEYGSELYCQVHDLFAHRCLCFGFISKHVFFGSGIAAGHPELCSLHYYWELWFFVLFVGNFWELWFFVLFVGNFWELWFFCVFVGYNFILISDMCSGSEPGGQIWGQDTVVETRCTESARRQYSGERITRSLRAFIYTQDPQAWPRLYNPSLYWSCQC